MFVTKFFKPTFNISRWSDRFSTTWTFVLFLTLAAITGLRHYTGPNATCWVPAPFTGSMLKYTEETCWLARKQIEGENGEIPVVSNNDLSGDQERTLYQWLPLILAFQALFFRLPDIVLRVCDSTFGVQCNKIFSMIKCYNTMSSDDRKVISKDVSQYLYQAFGSRPMKFLPIGMLTVIVAFSKLLIFINAVTQLFILEGYMAPANVSSYGEYVLNSIISENGTEIANSPSFPRHVSCIFSIRSLHNIRTYEVNCAMPVNELNEKVCFFVWVWILIVCLISASSGIVFLLKVFVPVFQHRYLSKHLQMLNVDASTNQKNIFIRGIGFDGMMVFDMIGNVTSEILVRDIINEVWQMQNVQKPENQYQMSPQHEGKGEERVYLPEADSGQGMYREKIELLQQA